MEIVDGFREAFWLLWRADPATLHAIGVSLSCTTIAVVLAALLAIPYGAWLACFRPRAQMQVLMLRVGMSVPTVIIGLLVFMLFSRRGLLGELDLLYTRTAIVMGEFLLAFPLLGTLTHGVVSTLDPVVLESSLTLGASRRRALIITLGECRPALVGACLAAFGRCITELGIALTVGGNLAGSTRTLPSTIQLELSQGNLAKALAPGILLLVLALLATVAAHYFSGERQR